MQEITIDSLDKHFFDLLKTVPEARREMFAELAEELLTDLRGRIGGAGKVQSWQEKYVGSSGGYAAVRPKADTFTQATKSGKRYAVGAVTNAIESGHVTRAGTYVPAKRFYQNTNAEAETIARRAMERFETRLEEAMGMKLSEWRGF